MPDPETPSPTTQPDPSKTQQVKEWKHARPLVSCRCSPAARFVCAGAQDELVQRWDLETDQKLELAGHESWVRSLAFTPDGEVLFSGDYAGLVHAWRYQDDAATTPLFTIQAHQGWVRAASVSPDGATLATAGNDRLVRLWSTVDGRHLADLPGHESHVYNVVFHPSGQHLASADLKGVVKHWDLPSGAVARQLDAAVLWKYDEQFRADIGGARGMAFSPDGTLLACSGMTEVTNAFAGEGHALVVLLDWETGERRQLLRPKENFMGVAWGVAFHPAGLIVAAGGGRAGGALWFWKPEAPEPIFEFKLPAAARDLDVHSDGLRLAIAQADNTLRIYSMA